MRRQEEKEQAKAKRENERIERIVDFSVNTLIGLLILSILLGAIFYALGVLS